MKQKVFLSGGFKSDWQKIIIDRFKDQAIIFNPRKHELKESKDYTVWDLHFIKQCDIIFAYMENSNPSGYGLSLEIGFGRALEKTIILVDEKSSKDSQFNIFFNIVKESSDIVCSNFNDGIKYLNKFLNSKDC